MATKRGNDGWLVVGLVIVGSLGLYYLQTGFGKNDSAFIPDTLEGRIDALITRLNNRFGKDWVNVGVRALKYSLQNQLPAPLVTLIDVVATVENASKRRLISGDEKRRLAVRLASIR